ncbi:hypothetical protein D9758_003872 [Tetrapyrgos nigripes]|uniref:Tubulin/FtsZ 2-layer sandwich domain-containing protein n=1 Tax=Tetrapyrgos nigripes TaxID=182062 RepID=A0A8H5GLV6_9AGAR|nr:hypothetical protein D9758_003872 [Tetrapyrgos nigripes]
MAMLPYMTQSHRHTKGTPYPSSFKRKAHLYLFNQGIHSSTNHSLFDRKNFLVACDPRFGRYLTAATIFRGNVASREYAVLDLQRRNAAHFTEWIPDNVSVSLCSVPPVGQKQAATCLANSTAVQELFQRTQETFTAMYKRRAFLHWYTGEGMDPMEFSEAESNVNDLITKRQELTGMKSNYAEEEVYAEEESRVVVKNKGAFELTFKIMMTQEREQHLLATKKEIASSYPNFQAHAAASWAEIIEELAKASEAIASSGPDVKLSDLSTLPPEKVQEIRRKGTVVIKDVVDDADAISWRHQLEEFVKANPDVEASSWDTQALTGPVTGFPEDNKQFFQLYWTKPQVEARSHPNMMIASIWLNNLYGNSDNGNLDGVDLSTPLTYADRFRIRHAQTTWDTFPPHIDGGAIERWEDPAFRTCFDDIFSGNWRKHDPYALSGRLNARSSLYQRPNQASIFRTFQGWLAMSETAPTQGTLKVFPDVLLSNAYLILRPFFRPLVPSDSSEIMDPKNWEFDISSADFPGIIPRDGGYTGPRPTPELHPHLLLDKTMTSVPKVMPGDAVFWHCDVVHSVEEEHTGTEDSAAMPACPLNEAYVQRQKECFLQGIRPPDFPQGTEKFSGTGKPENLLSPMGIKAMGLPVVVN